MSISDFSEMAHLTPQTLRYYHAEGLLVPVEVDRRTGYRSYAFEQVEQAMLITVLREAGLSVRLVRRALDEPDRVPALLGQHRAEVERERRAQDEAIRAAADLFDSPPEPRRRHVPATTVASRPVPGTPLGRTAAEWDEAEAILAAATDDLVRTVERLGGRVAGSPWRTPALETAGQKRAVLTGEGPFWLVKVPLDGGLDRPGDIDVQQLAARDEVSILMPGRNTMAKYCTAVLRLLAYPLDDAFPDTARLRQVVRADGVETSAPVRAAAPVDQHA